MIVTRSVLKKVMKQVNGSYTLSGVQPPAKGNKYKNQITELDGLKFDSKFEAKVWAELQLQERLGEISDLRRQVKYPLVVNGQKVCDLVLDFVYTTKEGLHVYADAKSEATRKNRAYAIKKKLFKAIHNREITEMMKGR